MADTKPESEKADEETLARRGENIAKILGLRKKRNGRYDTTIGDKTPLGLALTLQRLLTED